MDNKDRLKHGAIAFCLLIWIASIVACSASSFNEGDVFHIVTGAVNLLIGGCVAIKSALGIIGKK